MGSEALKRLAVACLALSIAAIAYGIHSSLKAGSIFGPGALLVANGNDVWISVDEQLWRANADGRIAATRDWSELGLPGEPANLVMHPQGSVVATVRDDATLYFLDPASARVTRRLQPQWPADLLRHGGRAINLAFHRDGRFAIATGGGHLVALFDADGKLLARTAPDTYRFTNGLWWAGDALWTTDTNRTALKRLDGTTLASQQSVALASKGPARYLGPARQHPQQGAGGTPMAALIRYENGMIKGTATLLDREGNETPLADAASLEPRDLDWLGGELLLSDGVSFKVMRWSADGAERSPFGDAEFNQRLQGRRALRAGSERHHRWGIGAAIATFAAAAVFVLLSRRQEGGARPAIDLSKLGTPRVSRRRLLAMQLRVSGPLLAAMLPLFVVLLPPVTAALRDSGGSVAVWSTMLMVLLLSALATLLWVRRTKHFSLQPEFEPVFNGLAVHKLRNSETLQQLLREGEQVHETFMLQGGGIRWAVLTDERLLVFKATLLDARLETDVPLDRIVAVSTEPGALGKGRKLLASPMLQLGSWIEIAASDGRVLSGVVGAGPLAARLVKSLAPRDVPVGARTKAPSALPPMTPRQRAMRRLQSLASALVPGLGQWMQDRGRMALMLFVPWLIMVLFITAPLVYVLAGPRSAVPAPMIPAVAGLHLLMAAIAGWDAWRMGRRS